MAVGRCYIVIFVIILCQLYLCKVVKARINIYIFESLKKESKKHTKTFSLQYHTFEPQQYLFTTSANIAQFIFKLRSRSLNCKDNRHHMYPILTCRHCNVEIESQSHTINCRSTFPGKSYMNIDSLYNETANLNFAFISRALERYNTFHESPTKKIR